MTDIALAADPGSGRYRATPGVQIWRTAAWVVVASMLAFLLNNYLSNWRDWPGASLGGGENAGLALTQLLIYVGALVFAVALAMRRKRHSLRADAQIIYAISAYLVRSWFWIVILVGLADMVISFLRVEEMLPAVFGEELATELGRAHFRGNYVHMPLIYASFVIALFTRTLGFPWLALLVVISELQIVIGRFIFSYEQAFMGDVVRFWYAGLFLFASAYTLIEEGHVRVDVLYSNFSTRTRGMVNAVCSVLLGLSVCIVIVAVGMLDKTSIINSALVNFEVSQSGYGMYIKYLMAGFLGVFAVSMTFQFAGYMIEGIADWRGDPCKREPTSGASAH
jgi:TRAP-type mannitol/chloroaromatic compound transport system permease small subunit